MADEQIESVAVQGNRKARAPGLSPALTGLLTGGAASLVAGPLGPLIGLITGIASKRLQDSYLDRESASLDNARSEHQSLIDQIDKEYGSADPDEQRQLDDIRRHAEDGWHRLASGDYRTGRAMIDKADTLMSGLIGGDMAQRKADAAAALQTQRTLVSNAAEDYRKQYSEAVAQNDEAQNRANRVFELVNDPAFDPNKPLSKGVLQELISSTGGMYRDTPDAWDALTQGTSMNGGVIAEAIRLGGSALATLMKSKDFKATRSDYYTLALNIQKYAAQRAQGTADTLGRQSQALQGLGGRLGLFEQGFSVGDYVTGGEKNLRLTPAPKLTAADGADIVDRLTTPTQALRTPAATGTGQRLPTHAHGAVPRAQRPVNGGLFPVSE